MPGRFPNPSARRPRSGAGFTRLPAAGRPGPPPPWPLRSPGRKYSGRRRELWTELWASPAAFLWERHRFTIPVARYAEMLLAYESDPASASGSLIGEIRQMEQALALTEAGLLRARASIEATSTDTPDEAVVVRLFPAEPDPPTPA